MCHRVQKVAGPPLPRIFKWNSPYSIHPPAHPLRVLYFGHTSNCSRDAVTDIIWLKHSQTRAVQQLLAPGQLLCQSIPYSHGDMCIPGLQRIPLFGPSLIFQILCNTMEQHIRFVAHPLLFSNLTLLALRVSPREYGTWFNHQQIFKHEIPILGCHS